MRSPWDCRRIVISLEMPIPKDGFQDPELTPTRLPFDLRKSQTHLQTDLHHLVHQLSEAAAEKAPQAVEMATA